MPAYQAARTIRRAMQSICEQQFSDWRLIVVDDGSTDGTSEVAKEAAGRDSRVKVITNATNLGAATSMNHAWRTSDTAYIAIMDADDLALPTRLGTQAAYLKSHPDVDVLGGAAHFIDGAGNFWRTVKMPSAHRVLERRRWYACPFVHPTVMMKRHFLDEQNGYADGLRLGEDYDLWMRGFYAKRYEYRNLEEPLVVYTAKPVQRWRMIKASARVRLRAGSREQRHWRGYFAAVRILAEGALEQTRVFSARDKLVGWLSSSKRADVLERNA